MSCWSHIHVEAFCIYKKGCAWSQRPKWCKKLNKKWIPRLRCMDDEKEGRCRFFGYCDCDPKDYRMFGKAFDEMVKKEEEKNEE